MNFFNFKHIKFFNAIKIIDHFKRYRNDVLLSRYILKNSHDYNFLIKSIEHLRGLNVVVVVAFEQPWAINWLLKMAKKNLKDATVLVFDNSRNLVIKEEIEIICKKNKVFYLPLPKYQTKHVNRSHGMAMSWIYFNVIKKIQPRVFAFLDHDLIPIESIYLSRYVKSQPFYGRLSGTKMGLWSLWAGFCVFQFKYMADKKINFLYDFPRGLDTGGRNWDSLYANFDKDKLVFPSVSIKKIYLPKFKNGMKVQILDKKWIHIGSISYNNNFERKFAFFKALAKQLKQDPDWTKLLDQNR